MDTKSLMLIVEVLYRTLRWVPAGRTLRDKWLRATVLVLPVITLVSVFVLLILVTVGVDITFVLIIPVVMILVIVAAVSLVRLRSRQVSSLEAAPGEARQEAVRCYVCNTPRTRRTWSGLLSEWRYCPQCEAAYCEECRGLLWTSAARGWTAECLACEHEWSIPIR